MTALVAQMINNGGTFFIGIILFNANGTINTNGSSAVYPASSSITDIRDSVNTAVVTYASSIGYTLTPSDIISMFNAAAPIRTYNNPTRTLNSAFQVSTTQDASVSYAVNIAATLSLVTGQTGTVILEYADDSGFTINVVTVQSSINGNSGALTIGLNLGQSVTASLSGMVPANKYVRLRTVNTVGTPSFTFATAQEVF